MAEEKDNKKSSPLDLVKELRAERIFFATIFIGAFGLFAYWLYTLTKRGGFSGLAGVSSAPPQINSGQPINIYNYVPAPQMPSFFDFSKQQKALPVEGYVKTPGPSMVDDTSGASLATRLFTTSLSNSQPVRLFTAAGGKFWRVQVRNIGPQGSVAMVSTDPSVLENLGVVNAEAILIPLGGVTDLQLRPEQTLFGRGNVASVTLSIAASVERT